MSELLISFYNIGLGFFMAAALFMFNDDLLQMSKKERLKFASLVIPLVVLWPLTVVAAIAVYKAFPELGGNDEVD